MCNENVGRMDIVRLILYNICTIISSHLNNLHIPTKVYYHRIMVFPSISILLAHTITVTRTHAQHCIVVCIFFCVIPFSLCIFMFILIFLFFLFQFSSFVRLTFLQRISLPLLILFSKNSKEKEGNNKITIIKKNKIKCTLKTMGNST